MRLPIQYALTHPERLPSPAAPPDLVAAARLDFRAPDETRFPALRIAREAGRTGSRASAALISADEVAVARFLDGTLDFPGIPRLLEAAVRRFGEGPDQAPDLDDAGRARSRGAGGVLDRRGGWTRMIAIGQSAITIVVFLLVLGTLVLVHELGHFVTARAARVKVLEFGIGFPPRAKVLGRGKPSAYDLARPPRPAPALPADVAPGSPEADAFMAAAEAAARPVGTVYTLNWLPIGGFVKLEGEDGDDDDDPRSFSRAGLLRKLLDPGRRRGDEPGAVVRDLRRDRPQRRARAGDPHRGDRSRVAGGNGGPPGGRHAGLGQRRPLLRLRRLDRDRRPACQRGPAGDHRDPAPGWHHGRPAGHPPGADHRAAGCARDRPAVGGAGRHDPLPGGRRARAGRDQDPRGVRHDPGRAG